MLKNSLLTLVKTMSEILLVSNNLFDRVHKDELNGMNSMDIS